MNGRVLQVTLRKARPLISREKRPIAHDRHFGVVYERGTPWKCGRLDSIARICKDRSEKRVSKEGLVRCKNHRNGFTLVEILLVLAVLVVFAGMTVPSVMRMFSQQKITGSAERVREAIASARFRAIESGIIYQFCCEANGQRYVVVPFEPDHVNSSSGQSGPVTLLSRASGNLPKGLVFSSTVIKTMSSSSMSNSTTSPAISAPSHKLAPGSLDGLPKASDLAGANWSIPILFNPEGSANADIEITISDAASQHVKLHVRAFTGAVSMERLVTGKR